MRLFLDTSALVKVYVLEPGSQCIAELMASADGIAVSALAEVEVVSALNRLRREKKLPPADYRRIMSELSADLETFDIVQIDRGVIEGAVQLLEHSLPLRAADALHLASALEAGAEHFISADRRQRTAAMSAGLATNDLD